MPGRPLSRRHPAGAPVVLVPPAGACAVAEADETRYAGERSGPVPRGLTLFREHGVAWSRDKRRGHRGGMTDWLGIVVAAALVSLIPGVNQLAVAARHRSTRAMAGHAGRLAAVVVLIGLLVAGLGAVLIACETEPAALC
ncbi:hypothetical protein JCM9534A_74820 [Catenuloplanes indicus JCM 9534]